MDNETLIERLEAGDESTPELNAEIIEAFGFQQIKYPRAGWKFIYANGRPGSPLWPLKSLEDLRVIYFWLRAPMPDMIPSDPRKAVIATLRARSGEKA